MTPLASLHQTRKSPAGAGTPNGALVRTMRGTRTMTTVLPAALARTEALTPRLVPALVAGSPLKIYCPPWCRLDHVAENERFLEDVHHSSASSDLVIPSDVPQLDIFASTYLWADSHSTRTAERAPVVVIDDGAEGFHLSPTQAAEFADRVVAFGERIRSLARTASEVSA